VFQTKLLEKAKHKSLPEILFRTIPPSSLHCRRVLPVTPVYISYVRMRTICTAHSLFWIRSLPRYKCKSTCFRGLYYAVFSILRLSPLVCPYYFPFLLSLQSSMINDRTCLAAHRSQMRTSQKTLTYIRV
jgi:hypothetical protein